MGKHDHASFRFKLDGMRLSPATPFDQERLSTYRNGSEIFAILTQPKNDKLLRKYWAILGRVIKDCPTPWKDKDQASEALKLSLGIVRYGKTVSGKFMQWPRSLAEMDAPEFEQFYEDAIALLARITGVDVETLKAESPDVGEDHQEPSSAASPSQSADVESGTGETAPHPVDPALDQSDEEPEGDDPADAPPVEGDKRLRNSMEECLEKFLFAATNAKLEDDKARQDSIVFTKNVWKDELPSRSDFVKACMETANKVLKRQMSKDDARAELMRWLP
jgi:hypothetical protein